MVEYKPNELDVSILGDITNTIRASLSKWYGAGTRLNTAKPEIRNYQNCFILRYIIWTSATEQKAILVKVRRNPKMDSLHQTTQANTHQTMSAEYQTLQFLYENITHAGPDFSAIRALLFLDKYSAIVMEEFPSRTMTELLNDLRTSQTDWESSKLKDAARKTGRWLYYFHHILNRSYEKPYTTADILEEARVFAQQIESASHGRLLARPILDQFARKLENIVVEKVKFSQSHSDMTTDNVLYSDGQQVCIIDLKNRPAPIYLDLGSILTHPEITKQQIFSAGRYYSETLLHKYREEIISGYFEQEPGSKTLVRIYAAVKVLDKWRMYEELMGKYKGSKHILSVFAAPLVSAYFQSLLKKYLKLIDSKQDRQLFPKKESVIDTSL